MLWYESAPRIYSRFTTIWLSSNAQCFPSQLSCLIIRVLEATSREVSLPDSDNSNKNDGRPADLTNIRSNKYNTCIYVYIRIYTCCSLGKNRLHGGLVFDPWAWWAKTFVGCNWSRVGLKSLVSLVATQTAWNWVASSWFWTSRPHVKPNKLKPGCESQLPISLMVCYAFLVVKPLLTSINVSSNLSFFF